MHAHTDDDGLPSEGEFLIDFEDLEFGARIGRGQYGHVYKGEYLGTCVAIKQCVFEGEGREMMKKYIAREISILKEVRHPNIVNFIGMSKRVGFSPRAPHKETIYIVTEWVPYGNLKEYLKKKNDLTWEARVNMATDVAASMAFLHQKNLIHRDLKPENLLITENGRVKLCDFGFARLKVKGRLMTLAGTETYMAPEVTLGEDYGDKCDVYGFGVVLLELIGRMPPPYRGPSTCFDFKADQLEACFPPDCPPHFKRIAKKCVEYYPKDRPSFKEILQDLKVLRGQLSGVTASPKTEKIDIDADEETAEDEMREDNRGPEIDTDRPEEEREDERGPEISFDDDSNKEKSTEGDRDERGAEIRTDGEGEKEKEDKGRERPNGPWRRGTRWKAARPQSTLRRDPANGQPVDAAHSEWMAKLDLAQRDPRKLAM